MIYHQQKITITYKKQSATPKSGIAD